MGPQAEAQIGARFFEHPRSAMSIFGSAPQYLRNAFAHLFREVSQILGHEMGKALRCPNLRVSQQSADLRQGAGGSGLNFALHVGDGLGLQ